LVSSRTYGVPARTRLDRADTLCAGSFDEPNLKATYDFAMTVPESFTALSNQPVKETQSLGNGLKKVSFLTVPKMSTYVGLGLTQVAVRFCSLGLI
jgi:hypothetical protein